MTFKDLSQKLKASVQTVPNLINVLADAFNEMEGGGSGTGYPDYSAEEIPVCKWIDGSQVYQKVFTFDTNVPVFMDAWTDVNAYIPNIGYKTFVDCKGYDSNGTFQGSFLCGLNTSNHVQVQSLRNGTQSINVTTVVLQYTKI